MPTPSFLKMVSTAATGGTVTNFSPRFSMSGMTGTFPQNVIDGMKSVTGTDGPAKIDATNDAAPANPAEGDFGVAYTMQTGLTRFAPMQPVPPTAITKKEKTPLFPTSSVSVATAFLPTPKIQTTITQSQTFSVSSRENTVRKILILVRVCLGHYSCSIVDATRVVAPLFVVKFRLIRVSGPSSTNALRRHGKVSE